MTCSCLEDKLPVACTKTCRGNLVAAPRPRFLQFLVVCLALLFVLEPFCTAANAARNVVLFIADDMSPTAGCYGDTVVKTPHLDALAKESTRYTHAFCTTASCSPSRAVIMTGLQNHANGQYGLAHGKHGFFSREGVRSLPVLMREAGYRTARTGRSVHVRPRAMYAFEQTFPLPNKPLTLERRLYGRNVMRCVEDSRQFIQADDPRPFFLMFATSDAHRFGTTFEKKPGRPNTFANDHDYPDVVEVEYDPAKITVPSFLPDTLETRAELAEHFRAVSRIDQGLGGLIKVLKETGHWDDTLLIFVSDHGMPFPGAKASVYEPGLHCPCVVRSPQAEREGIASDAMISWVDITPTILDYVGALPTELKFHGRSMLPTLGQEHVEGWDRVFASHTFHEVTMYYPMRVLRQRQYKLIWNIAHRLEYPTAADLLAGSTWTGPEGKGPGEYLGKRPLQQYLHRAKFELYDLATDPDELNNLADDPLQASRLAEMIAELRDWQIATGDPWQTKWLHE